MDAWCREREDEDPGLKISYPRVKARERRIQMSRYAYYRELDGGSRVSLSGSVARSPVEPPEGERPSRLATEQALSPRAIEHVCEACPRHPVVVHEGSGMIYQPAETPVQLVRLHCMEEDGAGLGPSPPVIAAEEAEKPAPQGGEPRTPISGERGQAAGGRTDGSNPREAAGMELEASRGPNGPGAPRKPAGNDWVRHPGS